jgi:putative serine protease PepD
MGAVNKRVLAAILAVPLLVACSLSPQAARSPAPKPSPASQGSIPLNTSPPVTVSGGFDPAQVAAILGPAVGMVIVSTRTGSADGSGFVILNRGDSSYMVTNNHVVEGATRIQVLMPDGRHFVATVQGTDPQGDIAILRLPDPKLPVAQFGDSTQLKAGQPVVAIGSPFGNQGTVTAGIISALHRTITAGTGSRGGAASETLADVIQTDAAINPGNSGGPLADAAGRVIGVTTAGSTSASGIGFAIPSLVVRRIAEALIAGQPVGHPYLGICSSPVVSLLASGKDVTGYGDQVAGTISGSPAEKAGVRAGDVIEKVAGIDLNNGQTLGGALQLHNPGEQIKITVRRGGSTVDLTVTLGDKPATSQPCSAP